mmetsp:Transcript_87326/g.107075  ORF Transcript_87326/g.107075 Transcript_87326/m.107075 type:complete len:176 (-) Transcript_87326:88-615(-)
MSVNSVVKKGINGNNNSNNDRFVGDGLMFGGTLNSDDNNSEFFNLGVSQSFKTTDFRFSDANQNIIDNDERLRQSLNPEFDGFSNIDDSTHFKEVTMSWGAFFAQKSPPMGDLSGTAEYKERPHFSHSIHVINDDNTNDDDITDTNDDDIDTNDDTNDDDDDDSSLAQISQNLAF